MPYTINGIKLAGFVVVLPFKIGTGGSLVLRSPDAFCLAQLSLSPSSMAAFPKFSEKMAKAGTSDWELADNQKNKTLALKSFTAHAVLSVQATGAGESIVLLKGKASQDTEIKFPRIPTEEFPYFMKDEHDRYHWGGELKEGSTSLLKIAQAFGDFDTTGKYVRNFGVAGPVRHGGCKSVFEWLVGCGEWYVGNEERATRPLPTVSLHDKRRGSKLDFFGGDPQGIAQATGAGGAVFFANGSLARHFSILNIWQLAQDSVEDGSTLVKRLYSIVRPSSVDAAMIDTALAKNASSSLEQTKDVMHEGMTVWNLNPRKGAETTLDEGNPAFL